MGDQSAQVEAAIEAVGEGGEVALSVLAVVQRVERTGQSCLQIAQHFVDPLELWQVARLERAHHDGLVHAARVGNGDKAYQTIAADARLRRQSGFCPLADRVQREAAQQVEFEIHRVAVLVERDRSDKWNYLLRAATGLTAGALAAEVGIVKLDHSAESMGAVLPGHGAVDLLVQQPSSGVTHADLPFECQCRRTGLDRFDKRCCRSVVSSTTYGCSSEL